MTRGSASNAKGRAWTPEEVGRLKRLAREGSSESAADALGRTVAAVQMKAKKSGISFRPAQPAAIRKDPL